LVPPVRCMSYVVHILGVLSGHVGHQIKLLVSQPPARAGFVARCAQRR